MLPHKPDRVLSRSQALRGSMKIFVALLLFAISLHAQVHPFVEPSLDLNGGGFQPISVGANAGVEIETKYLSSEAEGFYYAAKKTNDGTGQNPNGNVRGTYGDFFVRPFYDRGDYAGKSFFFGGSGSLSRLSTTNYSKSGAGFAIGGGYDFHSLTCPNCDNSHPLPSLRLAILYTLPTKDVDQDHGFQARVTIPSPAEADHHVFFDVNAAAGWIKTCESCAYTHDGSSKLGVIFRW